MGTILNATIPTEEYQERREKARQLAESRGLDALLVWSKGGNNFDTYGDVFYLTNHYTSFPQLADNQPHWHGRSHAGLVLPTDGEPVLIVDIPDPRTDLVPINDIRFGRDVIATTVEALRSRNLTNAKIGLIAHETLLHDHYQVLTQALPEVEWVPADDILSSLRLVKSDAEVAMLRQSSNVCVEIMNAMLASVAPGKTDGDVVAEGLRVAAKRGTQPWIIYMSSGPVSHHHQWEYLPTWNAERPYEPGDIVHPDIFGPYRGYFYDLQRSTVVGRKPSNEQRQALEHSYEMVQYIIEGIRPGIAVDDMHKRGCDWLEQAGYGSPRREPAEAGVGTGGANFPGFGHQLGLAMEPPFIMAGDRTEVVSNMVFAVEVDLGPVGNGAAYEDIVVVTPDGCETITSECPARWWD